MTASGAPGYNAEAVLYVERCMELSKSSAKVLREFVEDSAREQYGCGLMLATNVKSGSLYPILERFRVPPVDRGYGEVIDERAETVPAGACIA